jgi:hypothetical protein
MGSKQLSKLLLLVFTASLASATMAAGQAPLEAPQMPARTLFYFIWRGTPAPEARKSNALFALWDDPGFAPVRSGIVESLLSNSNKDKSKTPATREEFEQLSTLADNPFVVGYITEPEHPAAAATPSNSAGAQHSWNGLFFVYDRTGKEALLAKTVLRLRAQEGEPPKLSTFSVGNVSALKVERKSETTYWAETGKFAVSATERSVFEDILARVTGGKASAASSLAQSAGYQEAKPLLGAGVLEVFLRVPDWKKLAQDSGAYGEKLKPALESLKLDAVHSIALRVILEGEKTRLQGAILGDAAPGTIFDIWAEGQQSPAFLALLPTETIYYSEHRLNLPAIYELVKRAARAMLPENQQGTVEMVEGVAHSRLGMPIADALLVPSGEFASMQTSPTMDPTLQVYVMGIQKKPEMLKLIRTLLAERVASERTEGDTTFLKISLSGGQQSSGVAQWNFYHLAATPDLLLGARRSETLHNLLAQHAQSGRAAATSASRPYLAARSQFPEKVTSFSFFDLQKLDWQALKVKWLEEGKTALDKQKTGNGNSNSVEKIPGWLANADPSVFSRHLHSAIGASWKDAHGLHFDQWIN